MFKHSFVTALLIGAAAFPASAQAVFINGGGALPPEASAAGAPSAPAASAPSTPGPAAAPQSTFQWGDAGIGAGAAVVLLGTGAYGASMTRRRRRSLVG